MNHLYKEKSSQRLILDFMNIIQEFKTKGLQDTKVLMEKIYALVDKDVYGLAISLIDASVHELRQLAGLRKKFKRNEGNQFPNPSIICELNSSILIPKVYAMLRKQESINDSHDYLQDEGLISLKRIYDDPPESLNLLIAGCPLDYDIGSLLQESLNEASDISTYISKFNLKVQEKFHANDDPFYSKSVNDLNDYLDLLNSDSNSDSTPSICITQLIEKDTLESIETSENAYSSDSVVRWSQISIVEPLEEIQSESIDEIKNEIVNIKYFMDDKVIVIPDYMYCSCDKHIYSALCGHIIAGVLVNFLE